MADSKLTALSELSVPALEDLLYTVDDPGGTPVSNKLSATRFFGQLNHVCQGRLTLESGVAVSDADQSAKTNVYFTPVAGNLVSLYDGTRWRMYTFTELTLALGTLTSGLNYDVYLYDNAGTLTLETTAWTNDTTRATALTTQNGVYVKTGATTRRYLGTFRTTATTTTEDSVTKRFLWNAYNQVFRPFVKLTAATGTWGYNSTTIRQANADSTNKVEAVNGLTTWVHVAVNAVYNATSSNCAIHGVGVDSTTAYATDSIGGSADNHNGDAVSNFSILNRQITAGYHYYSWNENVTTAVTFTYYGNRSPQGARPGITGGIMA